MTDSSEVRAPRAVWVLSREMASRLRSFLIAAVPHTCTAPSVDPSAVPVASGVGVRNDASYELAHVN